MKMNRLVLHTSRKKKQRAAQSRKPSVLAGSIALLAASMLSLVAVPSAKAAAISWDNGGSDLLWNTITNWNPDGLPSLLDDLTFPTVIPAPGGTSQVITLSVGELAKSLRFQNNYTLTGGDLTIASGAIQVDSGSYATIASNLTSTSGFTKSGLGSVLLTGTNTFSGQTVIEQGAVVINNAGALGSDASPIIINGFSSRSVQGGQLVLAGSLASGITFTRSIALSGRGPATDGAALLSIGNNTFTGNLYGSSLGETRFGSAYGTATVSGNIDMTSTNNNFVLVGNGNFNFSGQLGAGTNANPPGIIKTGSGTLILSNNSNNILGRFEIQGGTIRVSNGGQLGVSTRVDALQANGGGGFEIRSDAGNTFAGLVSNETNNSTLFMLDRGIAGTGALNQSMQFGNVVIANNQTGTINGRNGTNLVVPTLTIAGNANGTTLTWNSGGGNLLTAGTFNLTNGGTTQTVTFNGSGDALVTGNMAMSGGTTPIFNKSTNGTLTVLGNITSATSALSIANGTLSVASVATTALPTAGLNLGLVGVSGVLNYLGTGGGALYGGSGVGQTSSAPIRINTTTSNGALYANQTGSAPSAVSLSGITTTGLGVKTFYFGGANALDNTISSVIADNTGALSIGKTGTGTWLFSGNNTYTGTTIVSGGTLKLTNAATTTLTGGLTFTADTSAATGWTGYQTAGGTLQYNAAAAATLTFTGALTPSAGEGNISVANAATLTFTPALDARAFGAGLNFSPGTGAIKFTAGIAGTNGIVGGFATINGIDFVTTVAAAGSVAAPTYTAGGASFDSTVNLGAGLATKNFLSNATQGTAGAFLANSLKVSNGSTLTLAGNLTITTASATSLGGILFDGSVGTGGITGNGITTSTASTELIIYNSGANAFTIGSNLLNNTATAVTKGGTGTLILSGAANAFTGNLTINEGKVTASGANTNILGLTTTAGNVTSLRQLGTIDINGAGSSIIPYGTATAIPTVSIGALNGGGSTSPVGILSTTANGAVTNSSTVIVTSATGLAVGQTVTGPGIGGYPVITAISGTTVTLSTPVTIANAAALAFSQQVTSGATITNGGAASAISLGATTGVSTGVTVYSGLIRDGAGVTTVISNGTAARVQSLTGFNTYTGATIISGGSTLRVTNLADGGVASSIGASTNAAGNLVFNNGILQYNGGTTGIYQATSTPSVSIDRLFTIAGAATIDSSGTFGNNFLTAAGQDNAALVFRNTGAVSYVNTGAAAARVLTLTGNSIGDNEIDLQLVNNGSTTNSLGITKVGNSLWILGNATNSYTGLTTLNAGQLRAQDGTSLPTNSPVFFTGGVLETSGTFARNVLTAAPTATSGAGGVFWSTGGGFAASNAALTVNLNSGGTLVWAGTGGSAGFVANAQSLVLGSTTSLFETNFTNPIDLNALAGAVTRTITVNDNANTGADYSILSGVISNSTGANAANLILNANAPLVMNGANTYNGTTNIATGELRVLSLGNSVTAPGAATSVGVASAATTAAIIFGNASTTGGTLTYVGVGETSDRALTSLSTTGGIVLDSSGSGPLVLTGTFTNSNVTVASNKTLSLNGLNADFNTITSTLTDNTAASGTLGITKNGGGIWVLSGSNGGMSGGIGVNGGILGVGSDNALGTGKITLNNGHLMAVGGDRTLTNVLEFGNNVNGGFVGNNSFIFSTQAITVNGGANALNFFNNLAPGKSVTLNNGLAFQQASGQTMTLAGSGAWIVNGAITQINNNGLTYSGYPGGSLTFGGSGTNSLGGSFSHNSGTVIVNRTGAFNSNVQYLFTAGYLQSTSATPLTGANALIPAILSAPQAGVVGAFNINGTQVYLTGNGAIEIAGGFNNAGAANRTIYDNMTSGAALILSGTVNLSSDSTSRVLTINGTGNGPINLTGTILPSSLAGFTNVGGTLIKGALGDFNIAPTSSLNAPTNGNLVLTGGTATFNQTNTQAFSLQKIDVQGNAALNIDYNTNNVTTSVGANSGAYRTINLNGGTLNFTANRLAASTTETLGGLQMSFASANLPFSQTGTGQINVINGGGGTSSLSFAQLNPLQTGGTLNITASALGTTNKVFLPGLLTNTAFGTNARVTVNGTDYATTSSTPGTGLVAFTNYVTSNNLDNTQTLAILPQLDNFNLTATPTFTGQTVTGLTKTVNNIKIGANGVNVGSGTNLFQLTLGGGGVLATGTGGVISVPVLSIGTEGVISVSTGADLTISSAITGTNLNKTGAGNLTLSSTMYNGGGTFVSGGKLTYGASNIAPNFQTATVPTLQNLHVNFGGIVDLNGTNQFIGSLNANNGLQGSAGSVTNSAVGAANLHINVGAAFGGVISNTGGALSIYKYGNSTETLTAAQTYTGTTNIIGGSIALADGGALTGPGAININYGGTLQINNTGNQDLGNRINDASAITLLGGTVRLDGSASNISQETIGTVTLAGGANSLAANVNGSGGAFLTATSLTRSPGTGATINFTGSSLGSLFNNTQSGRIILGTAPTLSNNLIGGWATTNGTEFASYIAAVDTSITPAVSQGVIPLQSYVDTTDPTWTSADNVKLANNLGTNPSIYTLGGARIINSLNIQSTTNPITVNNTALTLVSGGLLSNGVAGSILAGGTLTAGSGGTAELFINDNVNTTITSQITNNGAGVVSLVKTLVGTTTLSPTVSNSYGGTTTVNQGTLTSGSLAGIVTIPGALVVNNAAVTFTQLQQIASGAALTINGAGGNVTFAGVGNNVLGAVSFMDNGGITAAPSITGGTVVMSSLTSQNDNLAATPTVASVLDLNSTNLTVTTSGLSVNDLNITGIIQSAGTGGVGAGQLIKGGTGSLVLGGANTFTGGIALNNGTLIINTSAGALGLGQLSMAGGTTLMSGTASVTPLNQVNVNGNISLGGPAAANNINLGGIVALGGSARTITIASPVATATLSGTVTGSAALSKTGVGTLALTGGTLNYTPGINVNAGILSLDQTLGSFSAPIAVSAGATVNFNVGTAGNVGVSVNPSGTPFAISGAGQVTKTGAGVVNVYGNLTYTGPTTIQAGSLLLSPNAITNAAPTLTATSAINLGAPLVGFGLDNIGATGAINVGGGSTAINFLGRDSFISTTRNGDFASTLNLGGTVTRSAGATGIFNFLNNVTFQPSPNDSIITSNKILVGGSTGVIDQGVYITSGNITNPILRTDYAYRDAAGFVRQTAYGVDPGTYYSAGVAAVTATSGNFKIVGNVAPAVNFVAGTGLNTFLLASPNSDLTLQAGNNVINGIVRTQAGANSFGLLLNGSPFLSTYITNVQGGDVDNGGKELVVRVDSAVDTLNISSKIVGSANGFTKVGSGQLILSGSAANTYSGNTNLLGSGTAYLNKTGGVAAIPGNVVIGDTSNALTVQFGLLNNYSISASSSPNTGVASNNQIATSAIVTFNSSSTLSLNGASQTLAGIQTISGNPVIQNGLATGDSQSVLTLNTVSDFNLGAASTIRDAAAAQYANLMLVKQGAGRLTVGILANTGGVDVQGGVLAIGANTAPGFTAVGTAVAALGIGYLNVASGATLDLNNFDTTVDYLSGSGVITNSSPTGRTLTIGDLNNTNMLTGANMDASAIWSGIIADGTSGGGISLQKRGSGTQIINTAQDFTLGLHALGGTLVLDMSTMANPVNIVRSLNVLNLQGNLTIKGSATLASSQTFNGTTLFGGATELLGNANGGPSLTIDLGAFTRGANNATVNFQAATGVTYKSSGLTTVTGYATYTGIGNSTLDWAVTTAGVVGAYSAYTVGLPTSVGAAANNYLDTTAGVTTTATVALNSLKLAPTVAQTITLGGTLNFTTTATTGPGGILFDGTTASSNITGSSITGSTASTDLVVYTGHTTANVGTLTITSPIGTNISTVTKAGPDTLILAGNNTFGGVLRVNEGTVSFATVAATATAQPTGAGSITLGGNAKTATLNYTGATDTTWTKAITLGDGGTGQFSLTNGSVSTLTVGGVISGGGGLTVLTPTTSGSGLILGVGNTYLGQTIIQSGAKVTLASAASLGASGTIANGTVIQSGGQVSINDNVQTPEIFTISGTGIGGTGAILYNGATTSGSDAVPILKSVILAGNATIGATSKQISLVNGFVQGNGNTLTVGTAGNYLWLVNETIDNVPTIAISSGNVVLENMTLGGGSGQTLSFASNGAQLQIRSGNIDRALTFTGVAGSIITLAKGGDDYITQDVTMTNAASTTLTLQASGNSTLTINANILKGGAGSVPLAKTGGFVVLGGTANTFQGGLTISSVTNATNVGTLKIMPVSPGAGALTDPIPSANAVTFTGAAYIGAAYPLYNLTLALDNTKSGGAISQTLGALTASTAGLSPTIQLTNTTGNSLALAFASYGRSAGTELLLGITGAFTTPSATNKIDFGTLTAASQAGTFWNGSSFVIRDPGSFLRPINYGTDAGTNLVNTSTAAFASTGAATNHANIASGGSITAQGTATIGTLAFGAGATNLTLSGGATLTLGTAGILKTGGGTSTITGGTALQLGTASATDSVIRVDSVSDTLTINSPIILGNATTQTLSKFGQGKLILGGNSTMTGTMNVDQGTVRLTSSTAFGTLAANTISMAVTGGALELDGSAGDLTIANNIVTGITGNNSMGFMRQNTGTLRNIAGNNTINGSITSSGFNRTNSDAGTLTLANVNNVGVAITLGGTPSTPGAVAGNITILAGLGAGDVTHDGTGTLTLKPTASLSLAAKTLGLQGGTTVFDFTSMVTPTNLVSNTAILNTRGSIFQILGKATGATAQTFATFTQNDGITRIQANANGGTGVSLTLGAYAVPTGFGTIDFLPSTNVTYSATAGGAAVNNNGILGTAAVNGFATAGTDWAVINGTTILNYVTNGGTYTPLPSSGSTATLNYNLTGSQLVTTTQALNSLKLDASGGAVSLTVNNGQQLNSNAFLLAGGNDVTVTGPGTIGSPTVTNYFQIQGAGNLLLNAPVTDNSAGVGVALVFAGTGTGGVTIGATGSITMASNANTDSIYFEGGVPGTSRSIVNNGAINFNSKGTIDIGHTGTDSVVFTNNGVVSMTAGTFNVGNTASAYGSYVQSSPTSSFTATGANVAFALNPTANITNGGLSAGSASFTLSGGTFAVGGTSGNGNFLVFGGNGSFAGTQSGGTLTANRPGNIALFIAEEGTYGASSSYTQTGGTLSVNGNTIIGARNGAIGSYTISGSATANFYQGVVLGLQDYAQGTFTQNGGTVNIGTGSNISDGQYLRGNNTIDLSLGYNQTTNPGAPSTTTGIYNLNGGMLYVNGINTGQGNGYVSSDRAASNTFTDAANVFTTTGGGTGNFNWGGGTLAPFDAALTISGGVNVTLTAAGSTVNTNDASGVSRLVSFNTPITGNFGFTETGGGVVLLNAVNTYSGDANIVSGILRPGIANAIPFGAGKGNVILNSGATAAGTLGLNGFSISINGLSGDSTNAVLGQVVNNVNGTNVTLTVGNNDQTSTFNGRIKNNNNGGVDNSGTGTIALAKTGTGSLTLGGANIYTGATSVNDGALYVNGSLSTTSAVTVAAGKTFGGNGSAGAVSVGTGGTINPGMSGTGTGSLALTGLSFTGTGIVNFRNIQDGALATTINAGALITGGGAGSVALNVGAGSGAWTSGSTYKLIGYTSFTGALGDFALNPVIPGLSSRQSASLINSASQIQLSIVGDAPRWSGFDTTAAVVSTAWKPSAPTLTNWTLITGGGPTNYIDLPSSDQVLFDDVINPATQTSSPTAVVVDISNGDVTPSAVTVNNNTGGTFAATGVYTLQGSNGITGATGIVKSGNGTLNINNANTFTGGLQLNRGLVVVGNSAALGASTNVVAFGASSSATLRLNNFNVTLGGLTSPDNTAIVENGAAGVGSTLTINVPHLTTSIYAGTIQDGAGGAALTVGENLLPGADGTLVLTGTNTYTGGTTITKGALQIGNNGTTGSIVGNVTDNGSLVFNRTDSVTYPGTVTGTGTVTVATGTLVLTGSLNNSGTNSITLGATLQVGDGVTNGTLGNVTDSGTLTFKPNGSVSYTGTVTGGGAVNIGTGTGGTVVLTGNLNNTGITTIANTSTLQVGNNTASGTLGGNITDNGTLNFNRSDTLTYGSVISGTGAVTVSTGTVILTSGSSYGGGTTIANGATLQLGIGNTGGSITGDVLDNGDLIINRGPLVTNTASFGGNITGSGNLSLTGKAIVTLSSTANTFSGGTNIQQGTLRAGATNVLSPNSIVTIGSPGLAGTLQLFGFNQTAKGIATAGTATSQTITNGAGTNDAVLTLNSALTSTYGGVITNGSTKKTGITLLGGHTLILTNLATANTYTGLTAVQRGTLQIGAANAGVSASVVTLGASGTNGKLDLNGFDGSVGGLATDPAATQNTQFVGNSVSTANTLTLTPVAASNNVFGGVIEDNFGVGTGTTALTLNGANATTSIQTLTGASTYTGATTITQGILQSGNGTSGAIGVLGATAVTIGASGTLQYNWTDTATLGSVTGVTGAGAITLTGGGTLDTGTTDGIYNTTGVLNFGSANASTVLGNLAVNGNATVGSMNVQTNSASADTVTIATGKTLNVTGGATIGAATANTTTAFSTSGGSLSIGGTFNAGAPAAGGSTTTATFTNTNLTLGAAINVGVETALPDFTSTVTVTGGAFVSSLGANSLTIAAHNGGAAAATGTALTATLDLSGASSVQINGTAGSAILLGSNTNTVNGVGTADATLGTLKLSTGGSNTVSATTITLGSSPNNGTAGVQGFIVLGNSTNTFQADTIYVGRQKSVAGASPATSGSLISFAGSGGTWNLSGLAGAKTNLNIGYNDPGGTGTVGTGIVDLSNGNFNGTLGTLTIGFYNTTAGGGGGKGTLTIAGGTTTADAIILATAGGSTNGANNTGTLNLNGGTVTLAAAGTGITNGSTGTAGIATLNLNGGILDLSGKGIGGAGATGLVTLNAQSGTLKNLGTLNSGGTLTKTTGGTLILEGTNTYIGITNITAGTVQVGTGAGTGTLGSGNVTNAGALTFNRNNAYTASNIISGAGALNQIGSGTTSLTGSSPGYTGTTTISAGTLQLGDGVTDGTISNSLSIVNNAALIYNRVGGPFSYAGVISGSGTVTKLGGGTQTFAGSGNTYTGITTVSAGTLLLNSAGNAIASDVGLGGNDKVDDIIINGGILKLLASNQIIDSASVNVSSGTFDLNGKSETIYNLTISGTGNFKTGRGGTFTVTDPTWSTSGAIDIFNNAIYGNLDVSGTGAYTIHGDEGTAAGSGSVTINGGTRGLAFSGASTGIIVSNDRTTGGAGSLILGAGEVVTVAASTAASISAGPILQNDGVTPAGDQTTNLQRATLSLGSTSHTFTVGAGGSLAVSTVITGAGGSLTKAGAGTMTVSSASNYTGTTTVNASGGTLAVTGSLSGTTAVTVNAGGTLLLNANTNNIVNPLAPATVVGGTLAVGNSVSGKNQNLAALTLSSNSTLDFGTGAAGNAFTFSSSGGFTGTLAIWNWSSTTSYTAGSTDNGSIADGQDRLLFNADTAWNSGQLSSITFYSDSGVSQIGFGAAQISFNAGGNFEIVPVPEPATTALIGAVALCALIGYRERRRFTGVRSRMVRK